MTQLSLMFIILGVGMIMLNAINKNNTVITETTDNTFKCSITNNNETLLPIEDLNSSYSLSLIDYSVDVFKTDLSKNSIPAIFETNFVSISNVEKCLLDDELSVVVIKDNEVLVFPQKILRFHIAVNTYIKDIPILVTYSPLSDHYEVFSRNYKGAILEFGISGALYKNVDLIYDLSNESLWSQFNGKALLGNYTGATLEKLPYKLLTIGEVRNNFKTFKIMSFETGYMRNYDEDAFNEYRTDYNFVGTINNTQNMFENKDVILGFNLDNKQYSVLESTITDNVNIFSDGISKFEISKVIGEYLIRNNSSKNEQFIKEYTSTYAFVWYDFFPLTKKLNRL